jgi:D-alanyl-D-alanine dipeptidase
MRLLPALMCLLAAACATLPPPREPPAAVAAQLLVVRSPDWAATRGELRRYQRRGAGWAEIGGPVAVNLGKGGLGWGRGLHGGPLGQPEKREGDGRAPAGAFALGPSFGAATAPPTRTRLPYLAASATLECVDDSSSPHYNVVLDAASLPARDWTSSEHLRRDDELYDLGVVVEHNAPKPVPQAGSCIFLHVWRPERPTVGCTSMAADALREIVGWLDPALHPALIQLPETEYQRLRAAWQLP